jgi:hypothetical protein
MALGAVIVSDDGAGRARRALLGWHRPLAQLGTERERWSAWFSAGL